MNISALQNIIDSFKKIHLTKSFLPSFMEISGYPHYENVCSNILSFYFQTDEVHNLKDMLLIAMLKAGGFQSDNAFISEVSVERESSTDSNKRIDIFIKTDQVNIGIENKIFQNLYNDLPDYSRFIDKESKGKRNIKIVLSMYKADEVELQKYGFINVTYAKLFSEIEGVLGNYLLEGDPRYLSYLIDFIKTIRRLERGTSMNSDFLELLSDNEDDINRFLLEIAKARKEFRLKLHELAKLLILTRQNNITQGFYREPSRELYDTLYHEIIINNELIIAIDSILSASGWYFDVFPRPKASYNFKEFIEAKNIKLVPSYDYGRRRLEITYGYDDNLKEIAETLQSLINNLNS